jgi:hypothetical protein
VGHIGVARLRRRRAGAARGVLARSARRRVPPEPRSGRAAGQWLPGRGGRRLAGRPGRRPTTARRHGRRRRL